MKKIKNTVVSLFARLRRAVSRWLSRRRARRAAANNTPAKGNTAAAEESPAVSEPSAVGESVAAKGKQPAASEPSAAEEPVAEKGKQPAATKAKAPSAAISSYRADAIKFNERFIDSHYRLRYNTLKRATEFRPKDGAGAAWRPLTDRDLNRLTVEQLKAGGQSWSYGMKLVIDSSRVPDFNPVAHYLDTCPAWDRQHDYIGDLARRVPTGYAPWPVFFHRWLLALVAQARGMSRDYGNAVVPLLIGPQGTRKSTFCKNILPVELREYYMDDIKMDNAEQVERVLGRMWLVCIDEYDAKTVREQAKIKRLLTEKDVQVRRMRSDQYVMTPRLASFIATTNERRPLADPTGSRRYLCVEVEGMVDTATPVDHRQLFAQALWELDHGHPYHFSKEEEEAIVEHNREYQAMTSADELLTACFEPAEVGRDALLTATDILQELCSRVKGPDRPTMRQLTEALKNQRFIYGAQRGRHGWYARKRELSGE